MSELGHVLATLAIAAVIAVLPASLVVAAVQWTLGPLIGAARTAKSPSRFLLSDLAWLIVQLQLAMALAMYAFQAMDSGVRVVGLLLWCLPGVLLWAASLHLVSQAGITRAWRRAAVFVVLVPGMTAVLFCTPLVAIQLLQGFSPVAVAGQFAALAGMTLTLRWLAQWAVACG